MADISKITLPSGVTYDIKDTVAREAAAGGVKYAGVTTTELTDGSSVSQIVVAGETINAENGMLAIYGQKEFIYSTVDNEWHEFGDLSSLGALAYADTATGSYTPAGTVSQPTFSGTETSVTVTATASGSGNYTPAGTVSQPTFSGSATTSTGTFTPEGSVSLTNSDVTATVSAAGSGEATYTPAGTVGAPTISVATEGTTTTIANPTAATVVTDMAVAAPSSTTATGELVYFEMGTGADSETLILKKLVETTGDSITTSNVTVKTGDAAYEASAPTFTGTGARLVTGNISVPSSASFSGTEGNVSVSGTPSGTVSQPTFDGTTVQIAGTTTAAGTVSQPTFSGTAGSVTVSPD